MYKMVKFSVRPHIHRNISGLRVSFCFDPFKADQVCDWNSSYVFIERSFTRVLFCGLSKNPRQFTFTCVDSNPSKLTWDHYLFYVKYISCTLLPSRNLLVGFYYLHWSSHDTFLYYLCFTPITKYHQVSLTFPRLVHHFSERSFFFFSLKGMFWNRVSRINNFQQNSYENLLKIMLVDQWTLFKSTEWETAFAKYLYKSVLFCFVLVKAVIYSSHGIQLK